MNIIYKKTAIDDLSNIENYIICHFNNIQAANKLKKIIDTIALLKDNPYLGIKMSDRFGIRSELRYLVVSQQFVFYFINNNDIVIVRILDSRQDYLSLLF